MQVGGGGGRWNIELTFFFSLRNLFFGGGGDFGVFGAPHAPHPGVARGRKTIHFFL